MKRGVQKSFLIVILLLLSINITFAIDIYKDKEAELIYTSKALTIHQKTTAQAIIDYNGKKPFNWIEATMNFYPKETYRQTVLQETHNPSTFEQDSEFITYRLKKPASTATITAEYTIQTENEYKPVTKKVIFPLQNVPSEYQIYLEPTELIDTNDDIITTASLLASGKDDLFQISQDIAIWVTTTVEYDLTTITADANQKASWVLKNKYGVCDELSVLYISMLRSLGIPARMASGIAYTNSELFAEPWNPHAWVEVYFPGEGWIPFDLTYNQFGYVDASHIKFKDSHNADSLTTGFQWEGTSLDNINVDIQSTTFDMEVTDARGTISDPMTISTELLYKEAGFGSYNILEIHAKNTANHYVSSSVYVNAPKEVEVERETIPIYLKPNEEKTYYVLLQVTSALNKRYIYTMPIGTYTSFGFQNVIDFNVESDFYTATIQQVNSYLRNEVPENTNNDAATIACELSTTEAYINEDVAVTCIIKNTGNTYLADGEICLETKEVTVADPCESSTIPINHDITFKRTITGQTTGSKEFSISTNFQEFQTDERFSFIVKDKPNITVTRIIAPEQVEFGDISNITVQLASQSITKPEDIKLFVTIGSQKMEWEINEIPGTTNFIIPLDSRVLQEGKNTLVATVTWNDNSSVFEAKNTQTTNLAPLTFWQQVQSFFYGLGA